MVEYADENPDQQPIWGRPENAQMRYHDQITKPFWRQPNGTYFRISEAGGRQIFAHGVG